MALFQKRFLLYFLVFLANFVVFYLPPKYFKTPDTVGTRLIPISILREKNLDLNEYFGNPEEYLEEKGKHKPSSSYFLEITNDGKRYVHLWILTVQKDKFYTSYPIVLPLLDLPFYAIAQIWLDFKNITIVDLANPNSELNKLDNFISAFWTAVGGIFLFVFILKEFGLKEAIFSNLLYCFMSPAFSLLSHNTWQQTFNVALLPLLLFLLRDTNKWSSVLFGFVFCIFLFNRPTNLFFFPILFLGDWKKFGYWTLGAILPFIFFFTLHMNIYSHPLGGYYYHGKMIGGMKTFSFSLENLLRILFSPQKGLFIFLPYLLLIIPLSFFLKRDKLVLICIIVFFLFLVFYSSYKIWDGGWGYGPRFLSDLLPFFLILTIFVWNQFKQYLSFRIPFYLSLILSFWIHLQPSLGKDFFKHEACYKHPQSERELLWDWQYSSITAFSLKHRLLWSQETKLHIKELCHIAEQVNEDFSLTFKEEDFKTEYKIYGKYPLVRNTEFYFSKGKYEIELDEPSKEISLVLKKRSQLIETKPNEGGKYIFQIEKSGVYEINLLVDKPMSYHLKNIVIKK